MILVNVKDSAEPVVHDSEACEIANNGALIIFKNEEATIAEAAYAPGIWHYFEIQ